MRCRTTIAKNTVHMHGSGVTCHVKISHWDTYDQPAVNQLASVFVISNS